MDHKTALYRLLGMFEEDDGSIEWMYHEGTTIAQVDPELSDYLISILSQQEK